MIYTVQYIKKNALLSFDNSRDAVVNKYDENGEVVETSKYMKQAFAQSMSVERCPYESGSFMIDIDFKKKEGREQLNKWVKDCGLINSDKSSSRYGEPIESSNPMNIRDPFFNHEEFAVRLESGQAMIDDEHPIGFLQYKWFLADPRFMLNGEDVNPAISAKVEYMISKGGASERIEDKSIDESIEAMGLLEKMDFETQKSVLRAMGTSVKRPDPKQLKKILFTKITEEKDRFSKSNPGVRNIEVFLRYANSNKSDLKIREIITEARSENIILRKSGNKYYFGDIFLGNNLDNVTSYLEENEDILNQIIANTDLD